MAVIKKNHGQILRYNFRKWNSPVSGRGPG